MLFFALESQVYATLDMDIDRHRIFPNVWRMKHQLKELLASPESDVVHVDRGSRRQYGIQLIELIILSDEDL